MLLLYSLVSIDHIQKSNQFHFSNDYLPSYAISSTPEEVHNSKQKCTTYMKSSQKWKAVGSNSQYGHSYNKKRFMAHLSSIQLSGVSSQTRAGLEHTPWTLFNFKLSYPILYWIQTPFILIVGWVTPSDNSKIQKYFFSTFQGRLIFLRKPSIFKYNLLFKHVQTLINLLNSVMTCS